MGSPTRARGGGAGWFGAAAAELGETRDARRLVPGDPDGLRAAALALAGHTELWQDRGHEVRRLDDGGWSGHAADACHTYTDGHARRFLAASDATRTVADALSAHADAVAWAQDQAREAVRLWDEADDHATGRQRDQRQSGEQDDEVRSRREQAQRLLDRGREHLADAGRATAAADAEHHIPVPRRALDDPSLVTTPTAAITAPATALASHIAPAPTAPTPASPLSMTESYLPAPGAIQAALNPDLALAAVPTPAANGKRPRAADCDPDQADATAPVWPDGRRMHVQPGDTLTGIAERELGDVRRWRELYDLNHGLVQHNGQKLTWPWLIYPGWELVLPDTPDQPPDGQPTPDTPPPATTTPPVPPPAASNPVPPPPGANNPAPPPPGVNTPSAPVGKDAHPDQHGGGVDLGAGIYLGLGVAAAASAALLLSRRRRTFTYRPGSRRHAPDPTQPVIRQLHTAYQRQPPAAPPPSDPRPTAPPSVVPQTAPIEGWQPPTPPSPPAGRPTLLSLHLPMGTLGEKRADLDLTSTPGLVLDGAGAPGVARAVLSTMLAGERASRPLGQVLITNADAAELLGPDYTHRRLPTELTVFDELYAALTMMRFLIAHRHNRGQRARNDVPILLIATAPATDTLAGGLLTHVLAAGHTHRICAVLLGTWPAPTRCRVSADSTVTATLGALAEPLHGARLYTIPAGPTLDLLEAVTPPSADQNSQPDPPADTQPAAPTTTPEEDAPLPATPPEPLPHEHPETPDGTPGTPATDTILTLQVFGPPRLLWTEPGQAPRDITSRLGDKQRELLVYLALHPTGVRRDALAAALWPNSPAHRPFNGLHSATGRLRQALATATNGAAAELIHTSRAGIYQLDPHFIHVDYWQFHNALRAHRDAHDDTERADAHRQTLAAYNGELAEGIDTEWLDAPRYNTFRHTIDAADALTRHLADHDPEQALAILEHARTIAPDNETIYRNIIRLQHQLGRPDAADRTLALLTAESAEIGGRDGTQ